MAKIKIVTDDEFLRKRSKPVTDFNARLHQILDDMADTLYSANGLGLAGVQIGVLYRVCILNTPDGFVEMCNPEIIEQGKQKTGDEGCLSVPRLYLPVRRPQRVTVRAFDRHGKPFTRSFENIMAVCACHEIDHMDGILFTDKAEAKK